MNDPDPIDAAIAAYFKSDDKDYATTREAMLRAITAADEARAVTDEEVEIVLTNNQRSGAPKLHTSAIRAAGFKVIRG